MKQMNVAKLNQLYKEAEEVDKSIFSEMRSNVLLSAGEHYTKNVNKHFSRLRETNKLAPSQKLRLTKNNIYRVVKTYTNAIISKAPGVRPTPKNETEMQDRKAAELNRGVWEHIKTEHRLKDKNRKWCEEWVEVGEFAIKVTWDPTKGEHKGYYPLEDAMGQPIMEAEIDDMTGEPIMDPVLDQMGQPVINPETGMPAVQPRMRMVPDMEQPVMSGDFNYEPIHAFNLLRPPECKNLNDAEYLINRKLVSKSFIELKYRNEPEKLGFLHKSKEDEFVIFDSNKASYRKTKDEVMVRELFYKPCIEYPQGYFYIYTEHGVLEKGELPFGIYPIRWTGFDEYVTTPRARSIVKVARPYQAEINRAASQEATHQVTLGDDKILYQSGSKLSQGALLPGVRGVAYNGAPPTILPGRTGTQFGDYVSRTQAELYRAVFLDEVSAEKQHNLDPHSLLFRNLSQQAVFRPYIEKWEKFLIDVCELTLELARHYLPEDVLIAAVGKNEMVNIPEFKSTQKLSYQLTLEPVTDDAETLLGKQITFQHILQYVGKNMSQDDVGKILKNMPFVNNEESFNDLTIDYENVTNDMLALERGEQVQMGQMDNNEYYVKKLSHRMKQPDFKFLPPQVQQAYQVFKQQHQQEIVRKTEQIQRAKSGYIPMDGPLVTTGLLVPGMDGENPDKFRAPTSALEWLRNQMAAQGMDQERLQQINQGALAEMAEMMTQQQMLANGQNQLY